MLETERKSDPYAASAGSLHATANGTDSQQSSQVNLVSYMPRPAYRFKPTQSVSQPENEGGFGRRLRRNLAQVRRHIDCVASTLNHIENRCWQKGGCADERIFMQPHILYSTDSFPPIYTPDKPIDAVTTKFVRSAMNKVKCPIYDVCWTPEGRRLITGASSGEFTLWNGTVFNFETILQAHDSAVRTMKWSHNDAWLATADHDGFVKYWQTNMNNVTMFQAHKEAVRSISFCPSDVKFATASDDGTVRVWDFLRCYEERILRGHGSDVRSVDWHPNKSLLVSGSRDSQQPVKLWDPKSAQCLATLHDHKNAVMAVQWNANGNWFLSASKDHLIKLYDIRMMKELSSFKGHKKEVTAINWHPIHEGLFVSGSADGAMMFWLVGNEREVGLMETAHEQAIWTLKWHPLGHILASGSNDNNTKFWTRNKPGDLLEDFFGMVSSNAYDQPASSVAYGSSSSQSQRHQQSQSLGNFSQADQQHNRHVEASPVKRDQFHSSHAGATNWPQQPVTKTQVQPLVDTESDTNQNSNFTAPSAYSIPGLGGMDSSGLFRSRRDPRDSFPVTQPPSGRKPLLKQPPPKRAQRQFERVWNVGSQFMPDYEETPVVADPDYRHASLNFGNRLDSETQRQPLLQSAQSADWSARPGGADPSSQRHGSFANSAEPMTSHFTSKSSHMTSHYGSIPPTSSFDVGQLPPNFAAGRGQPKMAPDSWDLGGPANVDALAERPPAWGQVIMPPHSQAAPQFGDMDLRHAQTAAPQPPQWTGNGPPPFVAPPMPPDFPMPPFFPSGSAPSSSSRDPRALVKEPAGPLMPPFGSPTGPPGFGGFYKKKKISVNRQKVYFQT